MERVYSKQKETKCIDSMGLRYAKSYDNGSRNIEKKLFRSFSNKYERISRLSLG